MFGGNDNTYLYVTKSVFAIDINVLSHVQVFINSMPCQGLFVLLELVNKNETPPAKILCTDGSLWGSAGLLIQTDEGRAIP